jgi:hypothetical protein
MSSKHFSVIIPSAWFRHNLGLTLLILSGFSKSRNMPMTLLNDTRHAWLLKDSNKGMDLIMTILHILSRHYTDEYYSVLSIKKALSNNGYDHMLIKLHVDIIKNIKWHVIMCFNCLNVLIFTTVQIKIILACMSLPFFFLWPAATCVSACAWKLRIQGT